MRIAVSTIRNITRASGEKVWPTAEELAERRRRQELFNIVTGQGCGDCCGLTPLGGPDGSEFVCPLQRDEALFQRLTPEQQALVPTCGVPALYAGLRDGTRDSVTVEEVHGACPFISYAG